MSNKDQNILDVKKVSSLSSNVHEIRGIIFDFDGTLMDTASGIVATMRQTLENMQAHVPEAQAIKATIGLPLIEALRDLGRLSHEESVQAREEYERLFPTWEVRLVKIFPHVKDVLESLAQMGIEMTIATSRGKESLQVMLKRHQIDTYFTHLVTNDDHLPPKPNPDMVQVLLDRMNMKPEEVLVVGDTTFDMEMASGAGCETVAVTYGNHTAEDLLAVEPSYLIHSLDELLPIVHRRNHIPFS